MKICWAQYLLWLIVATLGVGGALSACGQKGALYHPAPAAQAEDAPEVAVPAHDDTQKATTKP
ncbi:MAG TPA: hypothetical protein ENI94_09055 [Gammaproteobacteria bacterium]|nr:hypothetical protein [Gammaproteobacteria bacterium]